MLYLTELRQLIQFNPAVDWRKTSLGDDVTSRLHGLDQASVSTVLPTLQAYQRIVRLLPVGEEPRAFPLLQDGLHSAIQITSLSPQQFEQRWRTLFPSDITLASAVYTSAQRICRSMLHHRLNKLQQNEPHYRAARFK